MPLPLQLPKLLIVPLIRDFSLSFPLTFCLFPIPVFLPLIATLSQFLSSPVHQVSSPFSLLLLICNVLDPPTVFAQSQNQTLTLIGTYYMPLLCFHYLVLSLFLLLSVFLPPLPLSFISLAASPYFLFFHTYLSLRVLLLCFSLSAAPVFPMLLFPLCSLFCSCLSTISCVTPFALSSFSPSFCYSYPLQQPLTSCTSLIHPFTCLVPPLTHLSLLIVACLLCACYACS